MKFLPYYFETVVLPLDADEVAKVIVRNTYIILKGERAETNKKFQGVISRRKFRISQKLNRPDNFLPTIRGKIEPTSKGCIIFTTYNLLFSTAVFVSFWTIVTLLLAILFLFQYQQSVYASISLLVCMVNYLFTANHFHRKVRISKNVFYSLFTT